ncbi:MAG: geranylgeranylglyceryl/heptaprenylglyceryl phosphate synthase [Flavobacteriales bacterium]|nr:geranylgeranylglyceryl/heptaprenylglyceryl phosphate synthase [Flavobacteriales bacterium]
MILDQIRQKTKQGKPQLAVLFDPGKLSLPEVQKTATLCEQHRIDCVLVGGSLMLDNSLENCLTVIKKEYSGPVILFPGNTFQVHPKADAILFLSLISGRNADLLIGKHVEAAGIIKASHLEVIPTGYMLISQSQPTGAQYMSQTLPIPHNKPEIAAATAMAGEMLGLQVLYLDAGSGASEPVHEEMIRAVKQYTSIPLIVGGGICKPTMAQKAWSAGANIVVIGTAFEKTPHLIASFTEARNICYE